MKETKEGKYADESGLLLKKYMANGAIVILFGGERGSGFSFSAVNREMVTLVPSVLREIASEIESEFAQSVS